MMTTLSLFSAPAVVAAPLIGETPRSGNKLGHDQPKSARDVAAGRLKSGEIEGGNPQLVVCFSQSRYSARLNLIQALGAEFFEEHKVSGA
jgi:hypothetical protein